MSHVDHIATHKKLLDLRWHILRSVRNFFWSQGFTEVETPIILAKPGQEPYLSPMTVTLHNEKNHPFQGYLHTSPEYTLKKMLAAGYDTIFSLGKVFRDIESFGGTHNPEFTLIEWYRANRDFYALMDDVEGLIRWIANELQKHSLLSPGMEKIGSTFTRLHMRDLWKSTTGINLDEYLTRDSLWFLCVQKRYKPGMNESYEDLFYRIFLNEIEPALANMGVVALHHYPLPMAALSRPSEKCPGYAERVEVYVHGIELANGFSELTDATEQRRRLEAELHLRQTSGKAVFPIDTDFIDAVGRMPPSTGIALGIDRLVQIFASCQNINDVIPLPASELFQNT